MSTQSRFLSTTYMSIYDFSLCGVPLMGRFSSAYPATVSPASKCLAVPRQVFANMLGWLPLTCPKQKSDPKTSKHRSDPKNSEHTESSHPQENLCWLSEVSAARRNHAQDWKKDAFPTFEFSVNGNQRRIRLSLEQLVFRREGRD